MSRANRGRVAAALALVAVERGGHVEDVLAIEAPEREPDRGLAWFLALGVLRKRGVVDAALRPHLSQPLTGLDAEVRATLRMGAFELLFARTPAHAAVSQGVEVITALGGGRARGLVNAVLRRVEPPTELALHERLDHPAWLVERWTERFGAEAVEAWCARSGEEAPLAVVTREPDRLRAALEAVGLHPREGRAAGEPVPGAFWVDEVRGRVEELPGFRDGSFWVQDPSATHVADLVGAKPGMRVLDACAAPGGKAFRMASAGAEVLAVDAEPDRLRAVTEGARRLRLPIEVRAHDWLRGPMRGKPTFDAVLVDAPCTGLGTLRRHPEIRWRRQLVDLPKAKARQLAVTGAASAHVAPGGRLVYAVCSPEPEEGPAVIEAFLRDAPDFRVLSQWSSTPPVDDEDAHFAAVLERA